MKSLIIDLDGTLTIDSDEPYESKRANNNVVTSLRKYQALGYKIVIYTSRNMRTHEGNLGRINVHTLPVILTWLEHNDIPFDEVVVGKPWCGTDGFYVDDKAIRPSEFATLSPLQITQLLEAERVKNTGEDKQ